METKNEFGVFSEDGKIMLSVTASGKLVVPPIVEDLAKNEEGFCQLKRNQLNEIVFSEGCTKIGSGWDIDIYDIVDHDDGSLHDIYLPSTIQEVDANAFSHYYSIRNVWVPRGFKGKICKMLPKHLAKHVKIGIF